MTKTIMTADSVRPSVLGGGIDEGLLTFCLPAGFGKYTKRRLVTLMFTEYEIGQIIKESGNSEVIAVAERIIAALNDLHGQPYCPICHQAQVTHFIVPDLDAYSPCFRQACCQEISCQETLVNIFCTDLSSLSKIGLAVVFKTEHKIHRRSLLKFVRDICGLPKKYNIEQDEEAFLFKLKLALHRE